jgi:hypothetical protein
MSFIDSIKEVVDVRLSRCESHANEAIERAQSTRHRLILSREIYWG